MNPGDFLFGRTDIHFFGLVIDQRSKFADRVETQNPVDVDLTLAGSQFGKPENHAIADRN